MLTFLNFMFPGRGALGGRRTGAFGPGDLMSFVPVSWVPEAGRGPICDELWPPRCDLAGASVAGDREPPEAPSRPHRPAVTETPNEKVVRLFPRPPPERTDAPARHDDDDDDDPGPAAA